MVQAWYFCVWLWNEGTPGAPSTGPADGVWHSRQSRFTWLRLSSRGLDEPWGRWQDTQPSDLTPWCSKTNGPALSTWHLKQSWSCVAVERSCLVTNPPCWL